MFRKLLTSLATVAVAIGVAGSADAATTLKIGTLAPGDSAWGKEFKKWAKDVSDDTNGELILDFQWNGQAGDEVLMVQKIRSGQLDGAAVTAIGLAQTGVTDALIFQMPGLFANWGKLDAARNAMKADFDQQFQSKGFTILGWGDVGAAKTMSIGFEIHHPPICRARTASSSRAIPSARSSSPPSEASRRRRSRSRRSSRT
jgi:TRAP-type C4-dicarboxylate transport system substrate-binding protein